MTDAQPMTPAALDAIRERTKGLSKGPWWVERPGVLWEVVHLDQAPSEPGETERVAGDLYERDAHFLARA